jgi:hypothetical protein
MSLRATIPAVLALALVAGGCGGGSDERRRAATPTPTATTAPDAGAPAEPDPADVAVVRAWADTLRRGHAAAAARYFALPSVVANGTAPLKLQNRAAAELFNRTLPCGAKLIDAEPAPHGFFIVTFRLTERPGPGRCGTGTGETARTAFRVRDGRITEWLRVQDIPDAPETLS